MAYGKQTRATVFEMVFNYAQASDFTRENMEFLPKKSMATSTGK